MEDKLEQLLHDQALAIEGVVHALESLEDSMTMAELKSLIEDKE